ncbi:MAG: gamma-glutamyltransferase [Rhodospirillaceae bacterium]|nr:gamma-glutamyltransferase [Rhodospirillaceae bacterium]
MWRNDGRRILVNAVFLVGFGTLLAACEVVVHADFVGYPSKSRSGGLIVADEPQAVLIAQEIIENGGSAADAAVALGFGLSVTLQSSAGLGGGGLCLVYDSGQERVNILDFKPMPAKGREKTAIWHVAVPTLVRGMYALHAKYGELPWQQLVVPAENMARNGIYVSRAFAKELSNSAASLSNDPIALDMFMSRNRTTLEEGDRLVLTELSAMLSSIRRASPSGFYAGEVAKLIAAESEKGEASLSVKDLKDYAPTWREAEALTVGGKEYYSAAYATRNENLFQSYASDTVGGTGFVVADSDGDVVACVLTMLHPFGLGIMPNKLGFLFAPSPAGKTRPLSPLAIAISVDGKSGGVEYAAASRGTGAFVQIDTASRNAGLALSGITSLPEGEEKMMRGLANAMFCENGLKKGIERCVIKRDPDGHGFGTIVLGEP